METIITKAKVECATPRVFDIYFSGLNVVTFDIETTGLNPAQCHIILIGLGTLEGDEFTVKQFFAEELFEEELVLEAFLTELENIDVLVTYNGKRFDVPFVKKRCELLGIQTPYKETYDLDIYRVMRHYSPLKSQLPNMKQKTLEDYMGLWQDRCDEISGAQSVELYYEYIHGHGEAVKRTILLHNSDDVAQLARLLPSLTKSDFHSAMMKYGFPVRVPGASTGIIITDIKLHRRKLQIAGIQTGPCVDYEAFDKPVYGCSALLLSDDRSFTAAVKVKEGFDMTLLDISEMGPDFDDLPCKAGFVIVKQDEKICERSINVFCLNYVKYILRASMGTG